VIRRLPRRAIASNFVSPDLCATNMADFFSINAIRNEFIGTHNEKKTVFRV
jgi:hypothetical protein